MLNSGELSLADRISKHREWVAFASLAWLMWLFFDARQLPNFDDFGVYYTAGLKALAHQTAYDVQGHYQFKYSPLVALIFGAMLAPIAALTSEATCAWVAYWTMLAGWIAFVLCVARVVSRERWLELGLVFALWLGMGLRDELKLGQVNLIALALAWVATQRCSSPFCSARALWSRGWVAGAALLLAIAFKLYCALFIPLLVFKREWRVLGWALVSGAVLHFGVLGAFHGFEFTWAEMVRWGTSLFASSSDLLTSVYNVSLHGLFARLLGVGVVASALWAACVVAWLALTWRFRSRDPLFGYAWVLAGIAVLNPLVWPYWCLFLFPALMMLAASAQGSWWGWIGLWVCWQMQNTGVGREALVLAGNIGLGIAVLRNALSASD